MIEIRWVNNHNIGLQLQYRKRKPIYFFGLYFGYFRWSEWVAAPIVQNVNEIKPERFLSKD